MKKILVTGANGFIGSHVLQKLNEQEFKIFTISSTKESSSNNYNGNFLDEFFLDNILNVIKPEVIIHLAWYTEPEKFYNHPINDEWKKRTIYFIKQFFLLGGKRFIFSSTCNEYGIEEIQAPISENNECFPRTKYGSAKNEVTNFLLQNYYNQSIILRNFFVCGPGENPKKLLSSTILNLLKNKSVFLRRPYDKLDFVDVRDVANVIKIVIENNCFGVFNVGSSKVYTPLKLARKIVNTLDYGEVFSNKDKLVYKDTKCIWADNKKLCNILNFNLKFDINKSITDLLRIYNV